MGKRRVLLAKIGWDGHDIGIKIVARMLRDVGVEVIYLGLYNTPEMVTSAAIQEDVDIVGLSILSGDHFGVIRSVLEGLKVKGAEKIPVIVGGVIPRQDIPILEKMGVKKVFREGASFPTILEVISNL